MKFSDLFKQRNHEIIEEISEIKPTYGTPAIYLHGISKLHPGESVNILFEMETSEMIVSSKDLIVKFMLNRISDIHLVTQQQVEYEKDKVLPIDLDLINKYKIQEKSLHTIYMILSYRDRSNRVHEILFQSSWFSDFEGFTEVIKKMIQSRRTPRTMKLFNRSKQDTEDKKEE